MDEGMLNDLLECSVCLERLDTSSKVLPCQHTYCRKCLQEILTSHQELRCPECRVLVEVKIDELPPNVLLMRILEGMRNAAPKKPQPKCSLRPQLPSFTPQSALLPASLPLPSKVSSVPLNQPHARALYDYQGKEPGDLSFQKGDLVILRRRIDSHWFHGETGGREGAFPVTYVEVLLSLPSPTPQCRALYDFKMTGPEEEGCLCFHKGTVLQVIRRIDDNWAEGRVNDKIGIFPIAFVEMNSVARALMKLSMNSQAGPSRVAPPTPSDDNMPINGTLLIHNMTRSLPPDQTSQPYPPISSMSHSHPAPNNISYNKLLYHDTNIISTSRNMNSNEVPNIGHQQPNYNSQQAGTISAVSSGANKTVRTNASNLPSNVITSRNNQIAGSQPTTSFSGSDSSSSMSTMSSTTPNTSNSSSNSSTAPSSPTSPATTAQPRQSNSNTNITNRPPTITPPKVSTNKQSPIVSKISPALNPPTYQTSTQKSQDNIVQNVTKSIGNCTPGSSYSASASSSGTPGPSSILLMGQLSPPPMRLPLNREKEKRHSFTTPNNTQHRHNHHRHSAEILSPSDVVGTNVDIPTKSMPVQYSHRRSQSNDLTHVSIVQGLPAAYVALYPYKPQKPDELELRKGGIYMVSERCQDGWFKGISNRTQKSGVFPGNYVAPARAQPRPSVTYTRNKQMSVNTTSSNSSGIQKNLQANSFVATAPPELPPRAPSPQQGSSKHNQNDGTNPLGRSHSGVMPNLPQTPNNRSAEKLKDKKEKGGVSLMKRLTSMKRSKSPPPSPYSSDNPVFDDSSISASPVHVRSGSCPSQLLQALPLDGSSITSTLDSTLGGVLGVSSVQRLFGSCSQRTKQKTRPSIIPHGLRSIDSGSGPISTSTISTHHRKSHSLDAGNKHSKQLAIKERFRCIVAYPPNSEDELELRVNDIILVHRKHNNGWYKGTLQRTGRVGMFPASFVEAI